MKEFEESPGADHSSQLLDYSGQLLNFQSNSYDDLVGCFFSILSDSCGFSQLFYSDDRYLFELNEGKLIKLPWQEIRSLVEDTGQHSLELFRHGPYRYCLWLPEKPGEAIFQRLSYLVRLFTLKIQQFLFQQTVSPVLDESAGNSETKPSSSLGHTPVVTEEKEELRMLRDWNRDLELNHRFFKLFFSRFIQNEIGVLATVLGLYDFIQSLPEGDNETRSYFQAALVRNLRQQLNFLELIDTAEFKKGDPAVAPAPFQLDTILQQSIEHFFQSRHQQDIHFQLTAVSKEHVLQGNAYGLSRYLANIYAFHKLLFDHFGKVEELTLSIEQHYTRGILQIRVIQLSLEATEEVLQVIQPVSELSETVSSDYPMLLLYNYGLQQGASQIKGSFTVHYNEAEQTLSCILEIKQSPETKEFTNSFH